MRTPTPTRIQPQTGIPSYSSWCQWGLARRWSNIQKDHMEEGLQSKLDVDKLTIKDDRRIKMSRRVTGPTFPACCPGFPAWSLQECS